MNSLFDAQKLGIKFVALETPVLSSSTRPLSLRPCFFLPARINRRDRLKERFRRGTTTKTKKKKISKREGKRKRERSDTDKSTGTAGDPSNARRFSTPSSSSSSSAMPSRPSDSTSTSASTSLRPSSFLSSLSSACGSSRTARSGGANGEDRNASHQQDSHENENGIVYPEILKSIADSKGVRLPKLPKSTAARRTILTARGPISKGKTPYNPTLTLQDPFHWRVTHVYEDPTYTTPHIFAEIILTPPRPGSRSALYSGDRYCVTAAEIRAMIRLMRLRLEKEGGGGGV